MQDKCIICGNSTENYFQKDFNSEYLGKCEYRICKNCGFVFNKTMYDMDDTQWEKVNASFHNKEWSIIQGRNFKHNPPYLQQALFLKILQNEGIILPDNWLDYASGHGKLSEITKKYFDLKLIPYEKFISQSEGYKLIKNNPDMKFNVVFSSALFEHIRSLEPIEEMVSLLNENGTLLIHTLIRENIPKDPQYFYLLLVHCSLFTNKSMEILMKKFGFKYSIYSPVAKTWALFKNKPENIEQKIENINSFLGNNYLYQKDGFMDYWKD